MSKIGYKLVKNNTTTAALAPYLGVAIPTGTLANDDIINAMTTNGTYLTEDTARYIQDAFFAYVGDKIASENVRISTGMVSFYAAISGSFASEDALFDPTKNTLYVTASCSQTLRDSFADEVPVYRGTETIAGTVKILSENDMETKPSASFGVNTRFA